MENIYESPLFIGLTRSEVDSLLNGRSHIHRYGTEEIIALQGDRYKSLLIIEQGAIRAEMTDPAGSRIIIERITAPRSIAPAFLYATDNVLPVDVIAATATVILSIGIKDFTEMLQNDARVLTNFMRSMSDRSQFLSERVRMLRFGTIKSKLASYLLQQAEQADRPDFNLPHTHQELADLFGVTRPALSRTLGQIARQKIITSCRNHVTIKDREGLLQIVRQQQG